MFKLFFALLSVFLVFCDQVHSKGPSFAAGGSISIGGDFQQNLAKNFSWDDPLIQQRLWEGRRSHQSSLAPRILEERALSIPKIFGPAIKLLSCLGCAKALLSNGLLSYLTPQYLQSQMLIKDAARLTNTCVFYTSRNPIYMIFPRDNLSKYAAVWGCTHGLITIWVSENFNSVYFNLSNMIHSNSGLA